MKLCCSHSDPVLVVTGIYMSFALAQSGQIMSSPSVIKPRPTNDVLQLAHMKQSLCQCRSSNEMNRVPPIPIKTEEKNRGLELVKPTNICNYQFARTILYW